MNLKLIERKDFYVFVFIGVYILNFTISHFASQLYVKTVIIDAIFLFLGIFLMSKPIKNSKQDIGTFTFLALISAVFFVFSTSIIFMFFKTGNIQIENGKVLMNIIFLAILPAISEEFFFRGYLLEKTQYLGRSKSYILNSVLFSVIHFNILQLPIIFIVSLWNCYLYDLSKNIKMPILFHLTFNILVVLITNTNFKVSPLIVFIISTLTVLPIIWILFKKNKAER